MLKKSLISLSLLILLFSSCSKHNDVQPATNAKACFTAPTTASVSVPVTFNSSCTVNASAYLWDFGDGTATSTDPNPAHAYSKASSFTVKLTVTAANKSVSLFSATITTSKLPAAYHMSDITADETWQAGYLHYVYGQVNIRNATVTIQPGVTVLFSNGAELNVGPDPYKSTRAQLIANGTTTAPIIFTADSQTPTAGFYNWISFGKGGNGLSSMTYCTVEYGGYAYGSGSFTGNLKVNNTTVAIENCTVRHNKGAGVFTYDSAVFVKFNNNSFTDYETYALEMSPNTPHSIGTGNSFGTKPFVIDGGQFKLPSATWPALGLDYILAGQVTIAATDTTSTNTLTIAPGVTIRAANKVASFQVGSQTAPTGPTLNHKGSLVAVGTATSPITFTSASETPTPYDWAGIIFYYGNKNSVMKYCNLSYGGSFGYNYNNAGQITVTAPSNVSVTNCTFTNSGTCAFNVDPKGNGSFQSFDYNTLNNGSTADGVYIPANTVHILGKNNTITAKREITIGGGFSIPSATWPKFTWPYYIDGIIGISSQSSSGAFLTLTAGSEFRMLTSNSGFIVGDDLPTSSFKGGLAAVGTAAAPLKFTSAKSPAAPGDWYTIQFGGTSLSGSKLQYAIVEYGGSTLGNVYIERTTVPTVTYCTITNSMTYGVITNSCIPTVSNITYSGNTSGNTYSGSW